MRASFSMERRHAVLAQSIRHAMMTVAAIEVALDWPADSTLTVKALAAGATGIKGDVAAVSLLGCSEQLQFKREAAGMVVKLPPKKPCEHAFALKITGLDLAASEPKP
jgi:alpha-L-fucosidase